MHRFTAFFTTVIFLLAGTLSHGGTCDADINSDGMVDSTDLSLAIAGWHQVCSACAADVDENGVVNTIDLLRVIQDIGVICPASFRNTELAGNSLAEYPHFEYVAAFNEGSPVQVAIDSSRFPEVIGQTADIYVVAAKTLAEWQGDNSLVDVTVGGAQTVSLSGGSITANTFTISGGDSLSSDAGLSLGRPYDVVLDMNQNGILDPQDFIDGLGDQAHLLNPPHGFYVVHDLTQPGPLAVTEINYAATTGSVTAGFEAENIFYPSDIASMGLLPFVMISHGNGHNYSWYDHIGNHLASYGYVVMSHANNTGPGVFQASTTTLEHLDAFLDQLGMIAGGALAGHVDTTRIVLIGHSRGGEGIAIAIDRIFDEDWTPVHYSLQDIVLASSIAPVDFLEGGQTHPHHINYHLWTGGSDDDVNGCASCNLCQTFHLHDRATDYRQSISLHGVGHGDFHNGGGSSVATGPCLVGRSDTHLIVKGYVLPLVQHYVEGNIPALDYLWRQWERFRPIGAPTSSCVVVDLMYREGPGQGYFAVDDFQSELGSGVASSGGLVTSDVTNLTEDLLDDANSDFTNSGTDAMNGMTLGGTGDDTRGVVFDFDSDRFYEIEIVPGSRDLSAFVYLQFRASQATRHPRTTAEQGDLTFTVTLIDGSDTSSSIHIGAYGGGIEEPYQRTGCGSGAGWANEFETIRIRLTDFLHDGSALNLNDIKALRFDFGPSFGSSEGRVGLDDIAFTRGDPPAPAGRLSIGFQGGPPELIAPNTPTLLTVRISGTIEGVVPGSAMMFYRLNGGSYQSVAMTPIGGDLFTATLPGATCAENPEYYFMAVGDVTGDVFLPADAPLSVFIPAIGTIETIFEENLDSDPGWTTDTMWNYGQPTGMGGSSGGPDPTAGHTNNFVYGYNLNGDYENNLPERHLTTTAIDCSGYDSVTLSFWRWLGVETAQYDHAYVRVSNDGVNWTDFWENGGTFTDTEWVQVSYDITSVAANQSTVFIRWTMGTTDTSVQHCGWNVDDISLFATVCQP